jgi:hypothetical protein
MKRVLIAFLTACPLAVGVAAAQAAPTGFPGFPGGIPTTGTTGTGTSQEAVVGTVVSSDPTDGTFVANAYLLTPPSMGTGGSTGTSTGGFPGFSGFKFPGFGGTGGTGGTGTGGFGGFGGFSKTKAKNNTTPTATQVTIYTDSSTKILVAGSTPGIGTIGSTTSGAGAGKVTQSTVGDLVAGTKFFALFPGSSSDTLQTLVTSTNPATAIYAQVPKQFYAFVGTVSSTSTTTTPETITVDVTRSLPSSLITSGTSSTFAVGPHTFIIGGSSLSSGGFGGLFGGLFGGSLTNISTGDLVAGGLIGTAGLTLDQVEASPLMFLLDLPAPATTTGSSTVGAEKRALKETMNVLHGAKLKLKSKKSHGKSKKSHAGTK